MRYIVDFVGDRTTPSIGLKPLPSKSASINPTVVNGWLVFAILVVIGKLESEQICGEPKSFSPPRDLEAGTEGVP